MATVFELKVDRNLIDTTFEGYKLNLEKLSIEENKLPKSITHIQPGDEYYSVHHAKVFGLHNHLIKDPWNENSAYFVAEGSIFHTSVYSNTSINSGVTEVWEFPALGTVGNKGRYNYTMRFASAGVCVASDGAGSLYLVHTGDRRGEMKWKLEYSFSPIPNKKPFSVIHALHDLESPDFIGLHCLLLRVEQREDVEIHVPLPKAEDSSFVTLVEWVTFDYDGATGWSWGRIRRLAFSKGVDFASLLPKGESVAFIAQEPFAMVYDSLKPPEIEMKELEEEKESKPDYLWFQTPEDVTVYFNLPSGAIRQHINFEVHPRQIHVSFKGSPLLEGELGGICQPDASTYVLSDQKLEILLTKASGTEKWKQVVLGDSRGEETIDPSVAADIHDKLAHLTSEKIIGEDEVTQRRGFNSEQLEECDLYPAAFSFFCRMNGENHNITHRVFSVTFS
ncbi:hypothetical protein QYM36_003531 [Artemia franciscana]|uniref:NudC domain-containing protein 1 n=1 Tax=Artemia franciscana TaxID=6661 RepID=A0AA88I461_ARTSF|nr:hypothetical protein QYM36_003531 [Artemia franciscana]